jgi:hypothetical protein
MQMSKSNPFASCCPRRAQLSAEQQTLNSYLRPINLVKGRCESCMHAAAQAARSRRKLFAADIGRYGISANKPIQLSNKGLAGCNYTSPRAQLIRSNASAGETLCSCLAGKSAALQIHTTTRTPLKACRAGGRRSSRE